MPIAVFLGMHLLFTDPATSPRTDLGRIVFGVLYGLTTVLAVQRAARARGCPGFYDKLLQVPLLNLSVELLDRLARSPLLQAHRSLVVALALRSLGARSGVTWPT